jgi:AbrB family looped-hinge helix DNA binding protein
MRTKISTKGQVVVPYRIRRKLDLEPGDALEARLEGQRIVLIPQRVRSQGARIVKDPVTGLPALTLDSKLASHTTSAAGLQRPSHTRTRRTLTSAQVRELLADFP